MHYVKSTLLGGPGGVFYTATDILSRKPNPLSCLKGKKVTNLTLDWTQSLEAVLKKDLQAPLVQDIIENKTLHVGTVWKSKSNIWVKWVNVLHVKSGTILAQRGMGSACSRFYGVNNIHTLIWSTQDMFHDSTSFVYKKKTVYGRVCLSQDTVTTVHYL